MNRARASGYVPPGTGRVLRLLLGAGLVVTALAGGPLLFAATAAGQVDDPTECERSLSDLFDSEDTCVDWTAWVTGFGARAKAWASGLVVGDAGPDAAEAADAAARQVNGHADAYIEYANAVDSLNASEGVVVVEVTFEVEDDAATRYLVAEGNVSTGRWTDLRAVSSTDHAVDATRTVDGAAARNAADELARLRTTQWFQQREPPSNTYASRLAGQYGEETLVALLHGEAATETDEEGSD